MVDISDMDQAEWTEHEKRREENRKRILEQLDAEISRDERVLKDKLAHLRNIDTTSEAEKKEMEELKKRITSNKEIRRTIAEPDNEAFKHNDFLDSILDRPMDIDIAVIPVIGLGMLGLLEIRELYYKWKEGDKK